MIHTFYDVYTMCFLLYIRFYKLYMICFTVYTIYLMP